MKPYILPAIGLFLVTACSSLFDIEPKKDALDEMTEISKSKKRIAVLDFINRSTSNNDEMAVHATKLMREKINADKEKYILVDETELAGHDKFKSDFKTYNEALILKSARALGLDGVVLGSIDDVVNREYGDEIGLFRTKYYVADAKVSTRILNISTKRRIFKRMAEGSTKEERTQFFTRELTSSSTDFEKLRAQSAVTKAVNKLWEEMPKFFAQLAWTGTIAKVDFPKYYISTARPAGVQIGNFLKVYSPNKTIDVEKTGDIMGMAKGKYKGTLRVTGYFGKEGAVAILLSGKEFQSGDHVVLHTP